MLFVLIWLAGDLANLSGAVLAGLLPTIIILAAYVSPIYCASCFATSGLQVAAKYAACDIILLGQIYYYRSLRRSQDLAPSPLIPESGVTARIPSEEMPLISERSANENEKAGRSITAQCLLYASALVFVLGTGVAAWAIDEHLHNDQTREPPAEIIEWRSQLLGWISAVLYRKFPIDCMQG